MQALCECYQIAPAYDPKTLGGRYPDGIRIAVVRDRKLKLMVADVCNNPAYGSGKGLNGKIAKHVWISDSLEMIRTRRIDIEKRTFRCEHLTLPAGKILGAARKSQDAGNEGQAD